MSGFFGGLFVLLAVALFFTAIVCLIRPIAKIGMGRRKRALGGLFLSFVLVLIAGSLLPDSPSAGAVTEDNATADASLEEASEPTAATPKFGETPNERNAREASEREAAITDHWVKTDIANEHSSPGGGVVNRVYYGQKLRAYEKRGDWYRTTEDGFDARWTRSAQLADIKPPERAAYAGPEEYQDERIASDAIPNPGEGGLTRSDVDILRKGAKLILQTRSECSEIVGADKSVNRPNTYYVTCVVGGQWTNVFFTRAEAQAATL